MDPQSSTRIATDIPAGDSSTELISSSGPDLVDTARHKIDDEITMLEQRLCALRHRRNDLAPILRLPPELLAEIFVINSYQVGLMKGDLWWTKVAHVCRYFRAIALDCPRLWSRFPLRSEQWVMEMIRRAKSLPLTVHCNVAAQCKASGLDRVAEEIGRVRELAVFAVKDILAMQRFWRHFIKSAPLLEAFAVVDSYLGYETSVSHVPSDIFGGEIPSLRKLELRQCTFCWHSAFFCPTVTSVILEGRKLRLRPIVEEILQALQRMPMLEVLVLDQILPDIPWDFEPDATKGFAVALPHLTYLFVDGLALNCATLLHRLETPALKRLVLFCQPFRRYEEFGILAVSVQTKFDDGSEEIAERILRSFTFRTPTPETLQLQAWTSTLTLEELRNKALTDPSLDIRLAWDGASLNNSVKSLLFMCRALPLRGVRVACLPDYVSLTSRAWIEIFGDFVSLEELWVCGRTANHLPNALRMELICNCSVNHASSAGDAGDEDSDSDSDSTTYAKGIFPALWSLRLEGVDFTGDECPESCFFAQLQELVMDRRRRMQGLQLHIIRCKNFIMEQTDDLETLGASVVWDGEELLDFDLADVDSDDSMEDYEEHYVEGEPYKEAGADGKVEESGPWL